MIALNLETLTVDFSALKHYTVKKQRKEHGGMKQYRDNFFFSFTSGYFFSRLSAMPNDGAVCR